MKNESLNKKSVFYREFLYAKQEGVRKADAFIHTLRCSKCKHEHVRRIEYFGARFASFDDMEEQMLLRIHDSSPLSCANCKFKEMKGDGSQHVMMIYSEELESHLVLTLRLRHMIHVGAYLSNAIDSQKKRVKVIRQAWIIEDDLLIKQIEQDDERLKIFWTENAIRVAAQIARTKNDTTAFENLVNTLFNNWMVYREFGLFLFEMEKNGNDSIELLEQSIEFNPEQPKILDVLKQLYMKQGDPGAIVELFGAVFEQTNNKKLLPTMLRVAYQTRRFGALRTIANQILEFEPQSVQAQRALVATNLTANIQQWKHSWEDLLNVAKNHGDRTTVMIAQHWIHILNLPIPNWEADMDRQTYKTKIQLSLSENKFQISNKTFFFQEAKIPIDFVATKNDKHYFFFVVQSMVLPHIEQMLLVSFHALRENLATKDCFLVPLTYQPLTYCLARYATNCPDVLLDLAAITNTKIQPFQEKINKWIFAAEHYFGATMDFSVESLLEIDRILLRFHDDGFGGMTFALQCQIASYISTVFSSQIKEAVWSEKDPSDSDDPWVLELPDREINLISKVGKMIQNGKEDSISHFFEELLKQLDNHESQ